MRELNSTEIDETSGGIHFPNPWAVIGAGALGIIGGALTGIAGGPAGMILGAARGFTLGVLAVSTSDAARMKWENDPNFDINGMPKK